MHVPVEVADRGVEAARAAAGRLGEPRSLAELGLREGDLAVAAGRVAGQTYANPRPVAADDALGVCCGRRTKAEAFGAERRVAICGSVWLVPPARREPEIDTAPRL